eukprot:COSAG02_NODE_1113_length_14503_cov_87.812205_2_plen_45_part_00
MSQCNLMYEKELADPARSRGSIDPSKALRYSSVDAQHNLSHVHR